MSASAATNGGTQTLTSLGNLIFTQLTTTGIPGDVGDVDVTSQTGLVQGGDPVQTAINRARRRGPNYDLVRRIIVKGAPVIEIYERNTAPSNLYHPSHDDPIP